MRCSKIKKKGSHKSRNIFIFSLFMLAVFLSSLAVWIRYSQKQTTLPCGVVDPNNTNFPVGVSSPVACTQIGGFVQNPMQSPTSCFTCPQCLSSCWTHPRVAFPICPFCAVPMVPAGINEPGPNFSLAVGTGNATLPGTTTTGTILPIPIQADAVRPHGNRGICTNCHTIVNHNAPVLMRPHGNRGQCSGCHTIVRANDPTLGQMPVGTSIQSKTAWQGVAAPAITTDAVKPTLIKEFGIEVCPAGGTGVKVAGVMGNSYASSAKLLSDDIIIECNGAKVLNVKGLQEQVAKAAPEANAKIKIMRNGWTKDISIMVGEGEMEGFTPIKRR
ncbi:PDZ domain-containing protein [Planctomycetota bacterium]